MSHAIRRYLSPNSALAAGAIAVVISATVAACGSSSTSKPGAAGNPKNVTVTLTNAGCQTATPNLHSGPLTFHVTNSNATAVSELELRSGERIVGERENLAPGFSGDFSLNLSAGKYSLYCPGANQEYTPLTVTGAAAPTSNDTTSQLLTQGTKQYAQYIDSQVALLVQQTKGLRASIDNGDLAASQRAYGLARPYYERIEPVAETFILDHGKDNLDADIDARINDVKNVSQWEGFHRIERSLFAYHSLAGMKPYAAGLVSNVEKLQRETSTHESYQPASLANGAVDLLNEVETSKITGEEERYSHIDILDFQANVEGSEEAFADLEPALARIDPSLATTVSARFQTVDNLLDRYRDASQIGGFVRYGSITMADKRVMAQDVQAVVEPLSQVASKVVSA